MDYMGVSNMIKSMTFKNSRRWREKSPDVDGKKQNQSSTPPRCRVVAWKDKEKEENESQDQDKNSIDSRDRNNKEKSAARQAEKVQISLKHSRRSRSSHFAKFKYPQQYHHGTAAGARVSFELERNIPQCLRRGPRYANQPVRQNCNFNPVNSVTHLKWHSIRSKALPGYRGPTVAKPPSVTVSEPDKVIDEEDGEDDDKRSWNEGPHNGNYEYVYKANAPSDAAELFYDAHADDHHDDDYEDEVNNNNQTPLEAVIRVLNSEGESDAESVTEEEPSPVTNEPRTPPLEVAEEIEEEVNDYKADDKPPADGFFKSSLSRDSREIVSKVINYQDFDDIPEEAVYDEELEDIPKAATYEDPRDDRSVAESIRSAKSSASKASSKPSSKSSQSKRSRKSSGGSKASNHSVKFSDSDLNEMLGDGSDDDNDLDAYMESLKTPRGPPDSGRMSRLDRASRIDQDQDLGQDSGRFSRLDKTPDSPKPGSDSGRFSRLDKTPVSRDGKFRKSVRINESRATDTNVAYSDAIESSDYDDIPEDKESGGDSDSYGMGMSMMGGGGSSVGMMGGSSRGSETPNRPRPRVVRPMTAVRRNLEEEQDDDEW